MSEAFRVHGGESKYERRPCIPEIDLSDIRDAGRQRAARDIKADRIAGFNQASQPCPLRPTPSAHPSAPLPTNHPRPRFHFRQDFDDTSMQTPADDALLLPDLSLLIVERLSVDGRYTRTVGIDCGSSSSLFLCVTTPSIWLFCTSTNSMLAASHLCQVELLRRFACIVCTVSTTKAPSQTASSTI
jgi:hypothetical protein